MNAIAAETARDAVYGLFERELETGYAVVGCHRYNTADGSELFRRVKLKLATGDKHVRPIWRDGFRYRIGQPKRPAAGWPLYSPPYPLIETDPVFIVEGEGCADALAKLGITAATSGSASSADAADWTLLHGRSVVIWPDNDQPGATYAAAVLAKLREHCEVRLIAPEEVEALPKGGDVVDWLAARPKATADDVRALPTIEPPDLERRAAEARTNVIDAALSKATDDPGALFERNVLNAIREARQSNPAQYQRLRAAAKKAGAGIGELDRLTLPERDDAATDPFPGVERWPDPVAGAELLTDIAAILHRHVVADAPTVTAATLWAVHTWCMDVLTVSPLAHITAPEKRCGKTRLLTALSRLVCRPLPVSNISPASLFRSMELWRPTLLVDEVDSFLRDNDEARGLINSGFDREAAFVLRSVGDDHVPTKFATWGAKALCGIGKLADTIEDRSIPLRLRRKVAGETVENIRRSEPALWHHLQSRIARWTDANRERIRIARPALVPGLNDRAQDCWEPLLAIADLAGDDWPQRARNAAIALHGIEDETSSIGVELLADIEKAFDHKQADRLSSHDLLAALIENEESPWAAWNRGEPINLRQLAARIKAFDIGPTTMRLPNGDRLKGYKLESFTDAFKRYLSVGTGARKRDSVTMASECGFQAFSIRDAGASVTHEKPLEMASDKDCHAVTDRNTLPAEKREGDELQAFDL